MKASELIEKIQEYMSQYGDNDVVVADAFYLGVNDIVDVTIDSRPDHPTDTGMCICLQSE